MEHLSIKIYRVVEGCPNTLYNYLAVKGTDEENRKSFRRIVLEFVDALLEDEDDLRSIRIKRFARNIYKCRVIRDGEEYLIIREV